MESKESCWEDRVESLLDQLLKFTAQLTELENDPQINAKALSGACIRRLDELKTLMPQNLKSSLASENEVLEKMRSLYARTQVCLDILGRKNNQLANELQTLSRTKHAINSYAAVRSRTR
ncbi:hypothetical protein SBDP1_620020 [Syntrophobacter sp. SbD1]|nr:hypothetical protein SBDP1_620020 [Syntrophobacter sp. SbD1]